MRIREGAVSHRFLLPLAIVGTAGLIAAFTPALAQASTGGQHATTHSISATPSSSAATDALSSTTGATSGVRTVHAPASTSHYSRVAARAGSVATDPNPDLAVAFTSGYISAFTITANASVTGYSTATTGGLSATVAWGDGTSTDYSDIGTSPTFSHQYTSTGVYSITLTVSDGAGDSATDTWDGMQTEGSEFTAYPPTRLLDTRKGIGAPAAPIGPKGTLKLQVGNPPIPESYGITAVVLNVTATQSTANGYLSVYANEDTGGEPISLPPTSNINFRTGVNVANLVIAPVGRDGVVDFYNGSAGKLDVLADVEGYFSVTEVAKYINIAPTRILDTRKGTGTGVVKQIPAGGNLTLTVAGAQKGAIPASGASTVAMNLTTVNAADNGVITAYPAGESMPASSNLNYYAGQTASNLAIVPLGTNGQVVFHNNGDGPVDLLADATGYFTTGGSTVGSAYVPLAAPIRALHLSVPSGTPTPYAPGFVTGASSMVFNATVTDTTGNGYLSLYPYDPNIPAALPSTSNLNYLTGQTVPNLAIVPIGTVPDTSFDPPAYEIGIYLGGHGSANVLLDLYGFFSDQ
jgi:PKD domain